MPSVFSSALPGLTGLSAPRWRLRLRHPLALGLFSVALLWLIWQIAAGSGWIQPLFLPAPQAVLAKLALAAGQGFMDATLWQHLAASLSRIGPLWTVAHSALMLSSVRDNESTTA